MPNIGDPINISWTSEDLLDNDGNALPVHIELSRDNQGTWADIVASTPNTPPYPWIVTAPAAPQCFIRVSLASDPTIFDIGNLFIIANATSGFPFRPGEARGPYVGNP